MSESQEVFQSVFVAEMAQVHDDMDLLCSYSIGGLLSWRDQSVVG
jgi:hypothetical protein